MRRFTAVLSAMFSLSLVTVGLVAPAAQAAQSRPNVEKPKFIISVPKDVVPAGTLATITIVSPVDGVCSGQIRVGSNAYPLTPQNVQKNGTVGWGFTPGTSDNGKAKLNIRCGKNKGTAFFYVGTGITEKPVAEVPALTPDCTEKNSSCASPSPDCTRQNSSCESPSPDSNCTKQNSSCEEKPGVSSESDALYLKTVTAASPSISSRLPAEKIIYLGKKACSALDSGETVANVHKKFVESGYLNSDETRVVLYSASVVYCPAHKETVLTAYYAR